MAKKEVTTRIMIGLRDHGNLRERLEAATREVDEPMNRFIGRLVERGLAERGFGRPPRQAPAPVPATAARRTRRAA
jgi:hypothetical protein